jgi:channel protein (hemolysin III family)
MTKLWCGRDARRATMGAPGGAKRIFNFQTIASLGACQPVSSYSHLIAAGVAALASVSLLRQAGRDRARVASIAVYVTSVILTLAISGIYHRLERHGAARTVMKRIDYYAIWLLIAGTFTAVHGVMFRGVWRWGVLLFIWSYAALGVVLQSVRFDVFSGPAGLALYLGMGWVGVLSIVKIGRRIGFRAARFIWYAGLVYSAGAVLEATGHPILIARWIGPHEVFHFAVIGGVALHWAFVRRLLLDHASRDPAPVPVPVPVAALLG